MKNVRKGTEYKTRIFVGKDKKDVEIEIDKIIKINKDSVGGSMIMKDGDNYVGVIVWR